MADVKIRNLPDWLVDWHKRRAEEAGVSLEERLRQGLEQAHTDAIARLAAMLQENQDRIEKITGILKDSTPLIRESRLELEAKFDSRPGRKRGGQVARPRRRTA
jgi:plasmid stability protein